MLVTSLNFRDVLDWFYSQSRFSFMLLFVSSFDGNDKRVIQEIVNNSSRIDRITGSRICFLYFIKGTSDDKNKSPFRWFKNISRVDNLYDKGLCVTMDSADDICRHFGILRTYLPAFILISIKREEKPQLMRINDYNDLESFLTPLNILNSYVEDRKSIILRHEKDNKKDGSFQEEVDRRGQMTECIDIPKEEIDRIKQIAAQKLNISLASHNGIHLIDLLQNESNYTTAILNIWHEVRTKGIKISRIIEKVRSEIKEYRFDVFISCKSQDYAQARQLYDYLSENGYTPFLADISIKEVGIDQYTALIGEVINDCQYMIVFATDIRYLETPYVAAEWHAFVNDINIGNKPNSKLVNILSQDIDIHKLPVWLRDKQCFTTENYKDVLLPFLR